MRSAVGLHRLDIDVERSGNFPGVVALADELKHLQLAIAQLRYRQGSVGRRAGNELLGEQLGQLFGSEHVSLEHLAKWASTIFVVDLALS